MNTHTLFVYGSLMKGLGNHRYLAASTFARSARTCASFTLLDLGHFPAMIRAGSTRVSGEVYSIDDLTLAALDRLEGHPTLYRRTEITLDDGARVSTYLLAVHHAKYAPVVSGDWRLHQATRHAIRE